MGLYRRSWLERRKVLPQLGDRRVERARLHRGEPLHVPGGDARCGEEEDCDPDGHRQPLRFIDAQDDRHRAKAQADGGEDQHGEAAHDRGGEACQLLAQLGAEQLEAGAAEVEDPREQVARRFKEPGAHLRLSRMPAIRPMAAAMPTAAHGCSRTWLSSSAPALFRCSRAARSDSSARARTSSTFGPAWSAVARRSASASAITARRSSISLSVLSMAPPLVPDIGLEQQPLNLLELGPHRRLAAVDAVDQLGHIARLHPRLHRDHERCAELERDHAVEAVDLLAALEELAHARLDLRVGAAADEQLADLVADAHRYHDEDYADGDRAQRVPGRVAGEDGHED